MFAGTASAAATTHWVDLDGMAGPSTCDETTAASTTVQAAIDLTAPGDTVNVCPGTYVENLVVNGYSGHSGISLRSVKPFKARIQSPDDQSAALFPGYLLAIYAANDVHVQWFHFAVKTWETCDETAAAISVFGGSTDAVIRANRIRPTGAQTWSGPCHLQKAIRVEGPNTKAKVLFNLIKDWHYSAIDVGPGAKVWIKTNSIRIRHTTYAGGECMGVGINSYGGNVVARNNQINQPEGTHQCGGLGFLLTGGKASVKNNVVDGMHVGIELSSDGTSGPSPADIANNTVTNSDLYGVGIRVDSNVAGATIHDNNASGNNGEDCHDYSSGGTGNFGTDNTWTNNQGSNDTPNGICSAP
jgi:hypothetical protein